MKIVYESNGGAVGDGMRVTRVSGNGQKLEVLVDPKTEKWSALTIKGDAPVEPPVEPEVPPVTPPVTPTEPTPTTPTDKLPWDILELAAPVMDAVTYVPPGQRYAHVKVRADRPVRSNYWLKANVRNVNGGGINVGGNSGAWLPKFATVWRSGDDQDHYITIDMQQGRSAGQKVEILLSVQGGSWRTDVGPSGIIEIKEGAVNALPAQMPKHRAPKRLDLSAAKAAADQDMAAIQWSDTGYVGNAKSGTPCWMSKLPHGYAQVGNGELGAYINTDKFPSEAINPHSKGVDAAGRPYLRLHSQRLPTPVDVGIHFGHPAGSETYPFQASVITGQRLDAFCRRRGIFRAQLRSADRRYSWPAFWCIGRWKNSPERWSVWPPEIDFLEHFNGIYGEWDTKTYSSSAQHCGPFGQNRQRVVGTTVKMKDMGFADLDLTTEVHDYACLIEDEYTWHFIDGIETHCYPTMTNQPNGNTEFDFLPILNVAVKPPSRDHAYTDGDGDMLVYGIQGYDAGSGYRLVDFTDPQPWANRQITA